MEEINLCIFGAGMVGKTTAIECLKRKKTTIQVQELHNQFTGESLFTTTLKVPLLPYTFKLRWLCGAVFYRYFLREILSNAHGFLYFYAFQPFRVNYQREELLQFLQDYTQIISTPFHQFPVVFCYNQADQLWKWMGEDMKYQFSIEKDFMDDLKQKKISENLKKTFQDHGISLSQKAEVKWLKEDKRWEISDHADRWLIKKGWKTLSVYGLVIRDTGADAIRIIREAGMQNAPLDPPLFIPQKTKDQIIEVPAPPTVHRYILAINQLLNPWNHPFFVTSWGYNVEAALLKLIELVIEKEEKGYISPESYGGHPPIPAKLELPPKPSKQEMDEAMAFMAAQFEDFLNDFLESSNEFIDGSEEEEEEEGREKGK